MVLCLFATVVSGCHDSSSDPLAVVLTEQTRGVLAAQANLPSLPSLVTEARAGDRFSGAAETWSRSWDLAVPEGRELRAQASAEAVETVARSLGPARVAEAVRSVGETLAAAAQLNASLLTDGIADNIALARAEHTRAVVAMTAGRTEEALGAALNAADLIREVGPESVTRLLLSRAEAQLATLSAEPDRESMAVSVAEHVLRSEPAEEEDPVKIDLDRARRLVHGAHLALAEGDYVRAIQRAFYACQVLGVDAG